MAGTRGMAMKAKTVFDFFGMPRELRDFVYDELLTEKIELNRQDDGCQASVFARSIPATPLFLVSRQFNTELSERSTRSSVLTIEERIYQPLSLDLTLDSKASLIQRLELKLSLQCSGDSHGDAGVGRNVESEIEMHVAWIKDVIAQMVRLHSLTIELNILPCVDVSICEGQLLAQQSQIASLGPLTACNVFHCDVGERVFECDRPKELVMIWSTETKCLQRIEREKLSTGPTG